VDLLAWLARRTAPARLLVVGTYRPADALAGGAPIGEVGAELRLRGLASELGLDELDLPAVATVLERDLPEAEVPEELARLVHRRTDGVPLFVVQLAQAWTDAGALRPAEGRWELAPGPGGADREVPDDLRRLLELQLDRLDPADLAVLEAAAVGGVEFAAATAASGGPGDVEAVEGRCAALARHGRLLRATGPVAWPDGTVSAGFRFAHDLHRTVLYERIPAGGPGCTPPWPAGWNGPGGRPRPTTPPSWPATSWPATTAPGRSATSRPPPSRRWAAAPPARPSATWRPSSNCCPASPKGRSGTRPSWWPG